MKKYIPLLIIPFLSYSQNWNQVANFSGDGRHHPVTFANDFQCRYSTLILIIPVNYDSIDSTYLADFSKGICYGVSRSRGDLSHALTVFACSKTLYNTPTIQNKKLSFKKSRSHF